MKNMFKQIHIYSCSITVNRNASW